jgi:hypothetical protein
VTPYRSLKNANTMKGTIYKHFHTLRKQKKITLNERNISISIAQMLHKKNPNFILSSGEVSLEGRIYLHHICNKALEKPSSSGSKSISSILHDGDYSWTYTPLTELKRVPLLEHFVQFVHYLMDGDCFNPYDKYSDETGKDKRQRAKNGYINDIYIFSQANATIPKSSPTPPTPDYTDIMHKNTVELYKESKIVLEVNAGNKDKKGRWEFSYRKKTDESKLKKVGKN